ncbi:MAG: cytidine deaminase [Gammaproteobacteria bacterium]|nr:MAG: cytidine deaminase [Gammaproteobacteria bacterium]
MRPSNDEYFIGIAHAVSKRATCERRSVGCVLTDKNHRIISTGYNSVPSKYPHCPSEQDCGGANGKSGDTSKCIARHAEDVAIAKCMDIFQVHTAYITTKPCVACTRRLLDTSCTRIVFDEDYPDDASEELWVGMNRKWSKLYDV